MRLRRPSSLDQDLADRPLQLRVHHRARHPYPCILHDPGHGDNLVAANDHRPARRARPSATFASTKTSWSFFRRPASRSPGRRVRTSSSGVLRSRSSRAPSGRARASSEIAVVLAHRPDPPAQIDATWSRRARRAARAGSPPSRAAAEDARRRGARCSAPPPGAAGGAAARSPPGSGRAACSRFDESVRNARPALAAVRLGLLAPERQQRTDDAVLAAGLDPARRPARGKPVENGLDLVGGRVPGRAKTPPGGQRVPQLAKSRLLVAVNQTATCVDYLRAEPFAAEPRRPLRTRPLCRPWSTCTRRDPVAERPRARARGRSSRLRRRRGRRPRRPARSARAGERAPRCGSSSVHARHCAPDRLRSCSTRPTEFGARAARRLREEIIGWLTTVSPDGAPQPIPVWFLWDGGGSILLYSRPGKRKLRNIAANPKVSLNLDSDRVEADIVVCWGEIRVSDDPPCERGAGVHREVRRADRCARLDAGELRGRLLGAAADRDHPHPRLVKRAGKRPVSPRDRFPSAPAGALCEPRPPCRSRRRSEDQGAVRDRAPHPDRLVDADRRLVLRPDEQADPRNTLEQPPAQVAHRPSRVSTVSRRRVDPDLLKLDRLRRPGRRLGLEQDRPVLDPEPRPTLADLGLCPPPEAVRVPVERIDPDLLLVGGGAGGDEQREVGERRLA